MIEALTNIIENGQGFWAIIVIFLMLVAGWLGMLKVKGDKISFGKREVDKECMVMKKQYEYAKNTCEAFEKRIPRFDGYNENLGRLISEKVLDEVTSWIMFNHIEDSKDYIEIKQEMIWNVITKETVDKRMQSDKFRENVDKNVEQIVKRLVQIRENN